MTQVKTVVFDMDGLIFDTEPLYYKANQKTADSLDLEFSYDSYRQFIGLGDDEYKKAVRKLYANADDKILDDFFDKSQRVLEYLLLNGQVELKAGLIELLEYLHQENIPAFVASNSRKVLIKQLLNRFELDHYFKEIIAADDVERTKPDPALFNHAFEKSGLNEKESLLVLEDSQNGFRAAQAAKTPVILIPDLDEVTDEMEKHSLAVYSDLTEVISYLEEKNN